MKNIINVENVYHKYSRWDWNTMRLCDTDAIIEVIIHYDDGTKLIIEPATQLDYGVSFNCLNLKEE